MRPNPGTGFLRIPPFVNGCIGNAGNYNYEDKAKKFKFRVQSGPLLIIAQPAFRGVGATSSSISAPSNGLPRRGIFIDELEEPRIQRQFLLRDPPMRPEPGTQ